MGGNRFKLRLSAKLSLKVSVEIAILLLAAMAVVFFFARQSLKQESTADAEQTLEGTVQHIDNVLLNVEQSVGNIYWQMLPHLGNPDAMYDFCRRMLECNPYIVGCAIAFEPEYIKGHKTFMAYLHRKHSDNSKRELLELDTLHSFGTTPYTEQVWFTEPMTTGQASWTDPLKDVNAEREHIISFCLPIYGQNTEGKIKPVGVMAADLTIELLSQITLEAKPSPNSYITLLGRDGSFIVHPDEEKLTHQTVFTQTEHGTDPSVREAAEAMLSGNSGLKSFVMNGKYWYVFYKPFLRREVPGRAMRDMGWSVGVVYPKDDIFGDYNRLLNYMTGIAASCLLLFFVLCRLFTHRQLLPLRLLTKSAQHIAEGNYNETIPYTRREDEVGQLQGHFQQMQQALALHINRLNQLTNDLEERTQVLRQAHSQAREANRMKTVFLHHMTNQMVGPSMTISKSVETLCNHYGDISLENVEKEMAVIHDQSETIIKLVNHLLKTAESETGKEEDHEQD